MIYKIYIYIYSINITNKLFIAVTAIISSLALLRAIISSLFIAVMAIISSLALLRAIISWLIGTSSS